MPNLVLTNRLSRGFSLTRVSNNRGPAVFVLLVATLWPGCSATPPFGPIARDQAPPTTTRVEADWDDVYAATVAAAGKTESVVLSTRTPSPNELVVELQTIRDEPVEVTARMVGRPASDGGSVPIDITCRYGLLGDAGEQRRMLDAISARLVDLRGVDYRPVR